MEMQNLNLLLPEQQQLPLLLDTELLAKITGFAEQTLRHWATNTRQPPPGWPEPVRIGRNVRYRTAEIINWINAGCAEPAKNRSLAIQVASQPLKRGRGRPRKNG